MKKTFIILTLMFLSLSLGVKFNVLNAQGTVEIGIGSDATSSELPTQTKFSYSVTQQIYTADELAGLNGNYITSVSFYSIGQVVTRNLDVYLLNTDIEYFANMVNIGTETSPVFSGDVQIADNGWTTIAFDKPFLYNTGGNIILCVYDHTESSPSAPYPVFKVYNSAGEGSNRRALFCSTDDVSGFSLSGISGIPSSSAPYNNQVKFTYSPSNQYVFTYQESVRFDDVRLGEYWTEREPVSNNVDVKVKAVGTTIKNISCNKDFFTLSYNLNTNPFTLNVSYNQEQSEAREYTGTITIAADGVKDVQIPVSVKFYEPENGDVWEKAICVKSNENEFVHYSSTGLYDDYILPGEENEDGKANDVVYEFTLARECNVAANVIGTNGNVAVYKAETFDPENLQEEKHGPSYDNNYYVGPPKTFTYNFDNGDLSDFILIDADGDGYGWEIENNELVSYSWKNWSVFTPNNYVYVNKPCLITETSKLIYDVSAVTGEPDYYSVVILEEKNVIDENDFIDDKKIINVFAESYSSYNSSPRSIELKQYAGKTVYIGFRHYNCTGKYHIDIDNLQLTYDDTSESSNRVADINGKCPAGTYYLVAAAEGDFTLNLSIEAVASVFKGTVDSSWEKGANWSKGSVPGEGDDIVIDAQAELSSKANINYLNIRAGGLTLNADADLAVDGTITDYDENGSIVMNDGAQVFQNNEGVKASFNMNIINPNNWSEHKDGWQLISSPLLNAETSAFETTGDNNDYDLYKYDGLEKLEWRNYKKSEEFDEVFKSGRAYLASYEKAEKATFDGTLNNATSFSQKFSYSNEDPNIYMANFHLVGNPFTFDMNMAQAQYTNLVSGYAALNSTGSAFSYFTSGTIPVGDGFFVKVKEDNASFKYDMNTKRSRGEEANSINVIATSKAGSDNVVIRFAGKEEGFDKLQNFNNEIATVYVSEDNRDYGIYNCESDVKEIGLNFKAEQMGNYTISVKPEGKFQSITLIDRFTGVETDMLLEDYNFIATSGSNHERFILKLGSEQQTTDDDQFVYQSGEELVIDAEGTIQIIDMMGRVVYSNEHSNGNDRISVSEFDNAAYIVRVVNEEGVKVQKVVVY